MKQISYLRHRFPGSIIQHAVWLYFRFDRAMFLIVITAMLNILIDNLSRAIRRQLRFQITPDAG
jgi:ABC-type phosphate/phosphonate transport system permease subunit